MEDNTGREYLSSVEKRMRMHKDLAERAFEQLEDAQLFIQPNEESNSIAMIVQHLTGNMLSRWTDFMTTDGEKEWRQRDLEFEPVIQTRTDMMALWNKGWDCFFRALAQTGPADLLNTIRIRDEELTVLDAFNRQLAHYPYHVGQIIFYAKLMKQQGWSSLSIPKKKSITTG